MTPNGQTRYCIGSLSRNFHATTNTRNRSLATSSAIQYTPTLVTLKDKVQSSTRLFYASSHSNESAPSIFGSKLSMTLPNLSWYVGQASD